MSHMTVEAVQADGGAAVRPTARRPFMAVIEGARLVLLQDRILHLGHLGDLSYGIALRQPGHWSRIGGCTIAGNYFGIYTSHGIGVRVVRNHVANSWVYGIDPQIESRNVYVRGNVVTGSGVHGIVLSARALVGAYVYGRASGNALIGNVFHRNAEAVRIRSDAPSNRVAPIPPRSEVTP
jgi:nitrous oxidase accessory protein NosD